MPRVLPFCHHPKGLCLQHLFTRRHPCFSSYYLDLAYLAPSACIAKAELQMLPGLQRCLGAALLRNQCPAPSSSAGAAATLVASCQSDVHAAGAQYWQIPGFSCIAAASCRDGDVASITCSIPAAELQHAKGCTCAGCSSQAAGSLLRLRLLRASMQVAGRQLTTSATDTRVCTASCRCERCRAGMRRFSSATADGRQLTILPSSICVCTSSCRCERCRPLVRRFSSATVDEMAREVTYGHALCAEPVLTRVL